MAKVSKYFDRLQRERGELKEKLQLNEISLNYMKTICNKSVQAMFDLGLKFKIYTD